MNEPSSGGGRWLSISAVVHVLGTLLLAVAGFLWSQTATELATLRTAMDELERRLAAKGETLAAVEASQLSLSGQYDHIRSRLDTLDGKIDRLLIRTGD